MVEYVLPIVRESDIRQCYCCGKEIKKGRIFCEDCNTPLNRQIFEFFSELPHDKTGKPIRPRGEKFYQLIKYYLAARLGLSEKHNFVLKSITGAGKSYLVDMIAFIELTHFPRSLTVIGSISEKASQEHILRLRQWVGNSVFRHYLTGSLEAVASKSEIKLATLESRVISMPQSEHTRTGWHPTLLLVDEVARMRPQAYYGSFYQMGRTTGVIQIACSTPFLDSIVLQDMWNDENYINIDVEPDDCWWIPKKVFEEAKNMPQELFDQLFRGKFRGVSNRVIPDDVLLAAFIPEPLSSSGDYVMGIDFGRTIDPTAVVVLDIETGDVKYTDQFHDDWQVQFMKIRKLYKEWNPLQVIVDKSGIGDVIVSELAELPIIGVSIHNDILKHKLIDRLVLAFYNGRIKIVPDRFPALVDELSNFVYLDPEHKKMGPVGRGHDDLVDALALAVRALDVTPDENSPAPSELWTFTRVSDSDEDQLWTLSAI